MYFAFDLIWFYYIIFLARFLRYEYKLEKSSGKRLDSSFHNNIASARVISVGEHAFKTARSPASFLYLTPCWNNIIYLLDRRSHFSWNKIISTVGRRVLSCFKGKGASFQLASSLLGRFQNFAAAIISYFWGLYNYFWGLYQRKVR